METPMFNKLRMAVLASCLPFAALAQDVPSMDQLLEGVRGTALNLQDTVALLGESILNSQNSAENGAAVLEQMLAAANDVNASLDRDSEIWINLEDLLEDWSARRDDLTARSGPNPALGPIAEQWQVRIDQARALRTQILDQATDSATMVEQIEEQREVILELYAVGAADAVLATMQALSAELGSMNTQMQIILDQTGVVAGSEGIAQN